MTTADIDGLLDEPADYPASLTLGNVGTRLKLSFLPGPVALEQEGTQGATSAATGSTSIEVA